MMAIWAALTLAAASAMEVQTWRWEVWNELWGVPGASETALGNYTRTFYAASAEAIKGVDATLRVGGPASAGAVVLPAFIEEVEALGLPLDFVSSHYDGNARECPPGWGSNATLNGTAPPFQSGNGSYSASCGRDDFREILTGERMTDALGRFYWNPDCFAKGLVAWAKSFVPDKYPFYVTEYNVAVGENDVAHDTSTAAAFLWRTIGALDGVADVLSWWAFSDIFEEAGLPTTEFAGYVGLEAGRECWCSSVGVADEARCPGRTIRTATRPAPATLSQRCGGTWRLRLYAVDCDPPPPPPPTRTVDAFATRDGAKVAVFLSNWDARLPPQGWSDAPAPTTAVTVAGVSGDLELYRIDEEHANPRARWLAMGAPAVPRPRSSRSSGRVASPPRS
ncbi:glycosyl hydrolase [Aureococcus anophagefferens]|nr:glycosyl hydrolase [Aureococcus anophagefferens]